MKTLIIAAVAALTFTGTANAANCELSRSTVVSLDSEYHGQMVVRCGAKVVATRAELDARGVDIFDAAAVQAAIGGNLPSRSGGSHVVTVVTKGGTMDVVVDEPGHDTRW